MSQTQASQTILTYAREGLGQRIGFGKRPAVLVIDMQNDFCDPVSATTLHPSIVSTYDPIAQLCDLARCSSVPVIYTQGLVAADGDEGVRLLGPCADHAPRTVILERASHQDNAVGQQS